LIFHNDFSLEETASKSRETKSTKVGYISSPSLVLRLDSNSSLAISNFSDLIEAHETLALAITLGRYLGGGFGGI
jgi:hypothetical protein